MKKSYFPYLPNSRNEDNKRYKYILDMMEKNPFTYHKRKHISSSCDTNNYKNCYIIVNDNSEQNKNIPNNDSNENNIINYPNGNNINQELLFFQKENDKYIDSYNSFMKQKSSTIETNAQKYLNYIAQNKKDYKINNNNKKNIFLSNNKYNNNINNNNTIPLSNELNERKKNLHENKSAVNLNINKNPIKYNTIEVDKKQFIPRNIKARGSDITNPFFYDCIAKEIIKKNQETMDYNLKESENKFIKNKKLSKYSDDKLAIAPGKINNPKYYNLGESVLDKNPIINKGQYSPSFSRNYNYFNRQPNLFDI